MEIHSRIKHWRIGFYFPSHIESGNYSRKIILESFIHVYIRILIGSVSIVESKIASKNIQNVSFLFEIENFIFNGIFFTLGEIRIEESWKLTVKIKEQRNCRTVEPKMATTWILGRRGRKVTLVKVSSSRSSTMEYKRIIRIWRWITITKPAQTSTTMTMTRCQETMATTSTELAAPVRSLPSLSTSIAALESRIMPA